jgi:hypothetical protein
MEEDLWIWSVGFSGAQVKTDGKVPIQLVDSCIGVSAGEIVLDNRSCTDKPSAEGAS